MPTLLDYKYFNNDSRSLIECISLLKSTLSPPNAYEQNKALSKHIVEVMMNALEEKLELGISIPRKLYDEWEPNTKVKIKSYECNALSNLGASVSTIPKSLCDVLGFTWMNVLLICTWRTVLLKSLWVELMMFLFLQIGTVCPLILLYLILIAIRLAP